MELIEIAVEAEAAIHVGQDSLDLLRLAEGVGDRHELHPEPFGVWRGEQALCRPARRARSGSPAASSSSAASSAASAISASM